MKLYRIWQTVNNDYDTYDSAVVCAKDADDAVQINPSSYADGVSDDPKEEQSWCARKDVQVECIGDAEESVKRGVICASFNAG